MKVYIVGVGLGDATLITDYARQVIKKADKVISTKRLFNTFRELNSNMIFCEIGEVDKYVTGNIGDKISVLASGDVGFYSISKTLKKKFPLIDFEFVNGISSLQYLCAKLETTYDDIKVISVHGREKNILPFVCYNKRVFALTGGRYKAHDIIGELVSSGIGEAFVSVGENLSAENERIITGTAKSLSKEVFGSLAVILIENEKYVSPENIICDNEFIRGKTPMTKENIRWVSINKLNIMPKDIVYDIGAGTGSVAIEMSRKAKEGMVYAIERKAEGIEIIRENKIKFGAYNVIEIEGSAVEKLEGLPTPDKVFIGGSGGDLEEIISLVISKNPFAKIVINCITLETLNEAMQCFGKHGLEADITCINVARVEKVGRHNMMKGENPIYIISI